MAQNLVQYIVVRKDLLKSGWPSGALITQACHACVAVIHQFYDKEDTQKYLGDVDSMHKVTLEVNLGFFNYCQGNILFFSDFPTFVLESFYLYITGSNPNRASVCLL